MPDDLLSMEMLFLVVRHGYERVLAALAQAQGKTVADVSAAVERSRKLATRTSKPRSSLTIDELLPKEGFAEAGKTEAIRSLAAKFENRTLLPTLHAVSLFLRREGGISKVFKSRRDALPSLVKVLSALSASRLGELLADLDQS